METQVDYDSFLTKIYEYSPYFGKERRVTDFASAFYIEALAEVKGRVLEIASCTGLLSLPLAKAGHQLDCVDISPYMQEYLREKIDRDYGYLKQKIRLHCCDIFNYRCEELYEAIAIPDSFLLAITNKSMQMELLRLCNSFLMNEGVLVLDVFQPWEDVIVKKNVKQCSRFRIMRDELYIVYTEHMVEMDKQLHHFKFLHKLDGKDEIQYNHTITYRYLYKEEIREMLENCGFEIILLDDTFNFGKYFSVIAKKSKIC